MTAELVVVKGAHRGAFARLQGTLSIGRSASAGLSLHEDSKVSHHHARVSPLGGERYLLEDLGSTNGTFVNQERIEQVPLRSGDLIKIGRSLLIFRAEATDVRLEDIALVGGGSSGAIARREPGEESRAAEGGSSGGALARPDSAGDGAVSERAAGDGAAGAASPLRSAANGDDALQDLLVAAGEPVLQHGLSRILDVVLRATGAARAVLFLRHPETGGLKGAAVRTARDAAPGAPVDPDLLSRAFAGEVLASSSGAAAPVRVLGQPAGVLYVDGSSEGARNLGTLTAAGVLGGLLVGLDRGRRLSASAIEIVSLAQAQVQRRPVDVSTLVQDTARLYEPVARQRGLAFEVSAPAGLLVSIDPVLFGRGLDKLVEHALGDARGALRLVATSLSNGAPAPAVEGAGARSPSPAVRLTVAHGTNEAPQAFESLLDPQGVVGDLRRAAEGFGDGGLAVGRVALLRAGARLSLQPAAREVAFVIDLEARPAELLSGRAVDLELVIDARAQGRDDRAPQRSQVQVCAAVTPGPQTTPALRRPVISSAP